MPARNGRPAGTTTTAAIDEAGNGVEATALNRELFVSAGAGSAQATSQAEMGAVTERSQIEQRA